MISRIGVFSFCVVAIGLLFWADKKGRINLGRWDNIVTIVLGIVGIIALVIPVEQPSGSLGADCRIVVGEIVFEKELIRPNESMIVAISVQNPDGHPLVMDWMAINGDMNPDFRTDSFVSHYTAPSSLTDDTVSVEVTATGCKPVNLSKQVRIISPLHTITPRTTPNPELPQARCVDGKWKGITEQGYEIYFTVNHNVVDYLQVGFSVYKVNDAALCPESGIVYDQSGKANIENNTFLYIAEHAAPSIEIVGEFESDTLATGLLYVPDQPFSVGDSQCGVFSTSWEATKQH